MINLLVCNYNNYFNRKIIKEESVDGYIANSTNRHTIENINFDPGDGVYTKQVIGKGDYLLPETNKGKKPDYAILYKTEGESEDEIISRWFILDCTRTRSGQYELVLKRDVITDHYNEVLESPIYIEKGYINSVNNPLLYNSEGLQVNQIKQYEVPLMDETKTGWVVGYIPRDAFQTSTKVESKAIFAQSADITVTNLSSWEYWQYCNLNPSHKNVGKTNQRKQMAFKLKSQYQHNNQIFYAKRSVYSYIGEDQNGWSQTTYSSGSTNAYNPSYPEDYVNWSGLLWSDIGKQDGIGFGVNQCAIATSNLYAGGTLNSYLNGFLESKINVTFNTTLWDTLVGLEGKILHDQANNLYYRIKIPYFSDTTKFEVSTSDVNGSDIINYINNNLVRSGYSSGSLTGNLSSGQVFQVNMSDSATYIELEQVVVKVEITIDNNRLHLEDAPYDMFCIPYSDTLNMTDGTDTWTCNKAVALSLATDIGAQSGSNNIYDIQLLPYCPNRALITYSGNPSETIDISNCNYDIVTESGEGGSKISAVIWCPKSTFNFEIKELHNFEHSRIEQPYQDVDTLSIEKYYVITPPLSTANITTNITTNFGNNIQLFKVNKVTGTISLAETTENIAKLAIERVSGVSYLRGYVRESDNTYRMVLEYSDSQYTEQDWIYMFYIKSGSSFGSLNISTFLQIIKLPNLVYYDVNIATPEDSKITNECNLYRLSAGNYSSMFEFSPAKSRGFNGYVVDCTYKPFQPWIHIIPKLGGLYGENFVSIDDARGLICGGDYSLTQLTNVWADYKLTNSTYQSAFDRDIQHMDVENRIAQQEQLFKSITGTISGGVAGGMAGGMAGGPLGALAGGMIGAGASLAGGIMDYQNMLTRQEENRDYAKDKFNFSLQNIQAIPTALSKTSSIVANTRIFPFLEVYTCTDVEKEAYRNKLKYDGMTIMAIGKLSDYIVQDELHYFKGQLIRIENLDEDAQTASEIQKEINKGVYM